jgi:DNA (cytosine-5)-methyltransferase 1
MSDVWDPDTEIEENRHNWSGEPEHRSPLEERTNSDRPKAIDLFCGPGGLSQGLEQAGFETVLGVDIHEPSIETFQRNHRGAHAILGDIRRVNRRQGDERDIFEVIDGETTDGTLLEDIATRALDGEPLSLLTAGIPCQGFSIANRKQSDEDERNYLFEEFIRATKLLDPEFVLIENVSTMKAAKDGEFVAAVVECLERLGYRVDYRTLNAADFGVPQSRERLFFLGTRGDGPIIWPKPTHEDDHVPVSEAISDLPELGPGESATECAAEADRSAYETRMRETEVDGLTSEGIRNHQAPNHRQTTVERVEGTDPGEPMYDRFRQRIRLHPDETGPTIIAGGIRPQFQYGHYEQGRGLSVRERARIQSFPDSYVFEGGTVQGRVQTGMAVPPLLGQRLGEAIRSSERAESLVEDLLDWGEANRRAFPWRDEDCTPYEVFIAAMLLRRTAADAVEPVYRAFIERYPDLSALSSADREELAELLEPLGLHTERAKALRDITSQLVFSGIPETEEELLALPHVGRYAANATLCFGYGQRRPIVDANVARIYSRAFDMDVRDEQLHEDDHLWDFAESLLPTERHRRYNLALLDLGAGTCTAESPACESCPVNALCEYYTEGGRKGD